MIALVLPVAAVTFAGLLEEMVDRDALSRLPAIPYESRQASSYNRESTHRDKPGWFADSDGTGYIRQDENGEYVLMEHDGPGCITKIWTPFFYYDFNERKGPNVRIYLDGSKAPVLDESLIELVLGKGSIRPPFAQATARAGNSYLPIPFSRSCRVTMKEKPFYNIIAYRAYNKGTKVETFRPSMLGERSVIEKAAKALTITPSPSQKPWTLLEVPPGKTVRVPAMNNGPAQIEEMSFRIPTATRNPAVLRSTVLSIKFDGQETVWCPLGDFFSIPDAIHPYRTFDRQVEPDGSMTVRWTMPYRKSAVISIHNAASAPVAVGMRTTSTRRPWDARSMVFCARWRADDIVPGTPFVDWNFVDIRGRGVYVGDSWTVLNMRKNSWWGEGDEKIYVDGDWDRGFPSLFGTGTEDYYGWAGGVYPDLRDEFSQPFLANVKVGGLDGHTQGYNICTRVRGLDAIPFSNRLRFDMEASFGTDMRTKDDLLGYSAVVFFYARPGATHNRAADPRAAAKPIMNLGRLRKLSGSNERQK